MPRPKAAASLDVLDEIRAFRAKRDAMVAELRKRREQAVITIEEIDQALAELGGAGERAGAALVPNPAQAAPTRVSKPSAPAAVPKQPKPPEARGIRAGDPVAVELTDLLPWVGAAGGQGTTRRDAIRLRAAGVGVADIAAKLGIDRKSAENAITHGRTRMREARSQGAPAAKGASDPEDAPAPSHRDVRPANNIAPRAPTGWDRSDPDQDFTDIEPAPEPAPVLAVVPPPVDEPPPVEEIDDEPGQAAVERVRSRLTVVDGRVRSKTIAPGRLSRAERIAGDDLDYPVDIERPRTRGDCEQTARPCPWASCSHHLYLDANPETGAIKLNFPHLEVWELAETCSLDVADRGGVTLEQVGAIINLTRERIRQVEVRALDKIRDRGDFEQAVDHRGSPLAEAISGE